MNPSTQSSGIGTGVTETEPPRTDGDPRQRRHARPLAGDHLGHVVHRPEVAERVVGEGQDHHRARGHAPQLAQTRLDVAPLVDGDHRHRGVERRRRRTAATRPRRRRRADSAGRASPPTARPRRRSDRPARTSPLPHRRSAPSGPRPKRNGPSPRCADRRAAGRRTRPRAAPRSRNRLPGSAGSSHPLRASRQATSSRRTERS